MNVGMLGTGTIAGRLSETFLKMGGNVKTYAIASTSGSEEKKRRFTEEYGWEKWYDSYEELMADPEVDIVYIAVPNPMHYELCVQALEHGRHVICEKPFCVTEKQSREIFDLAREKGLFITEAVWTNYMPSRKLIDDVLQEGEIGDVTDVEIWLKSYILFKDRMKNPALAGGALLDLGPYTFNLLFSHFGSGIRTMKNDILYLDTGLDGEDDMLFVLDNGIRVRMVISCSSDVDVRFCEIRGTKGRIYIEGTTNPKKITVFDVFGKVKKEIPVPEQISGYEYEFLACERAISNGWLECPEMPHKQTLTVMRLLDTLRNIGNIHFPCE